MDNKIHVIKSITNRSLVDYAEGLLERCKSGEVVSITALEELPLGTYRVDGSFVEDRLRAAGALLEAAINRLGYE